MLTEPVDLNTLFAEQTLLALYRKAPSFWSNRFNAVVATMMFLLLAAIASTHEFVPAVRTAVVIPFADVFNLWANAGAALAGTILGFLIAGFAILCTVLRPQTMIALQKLENERYKVSELKLLLVSFVDVMIQYLGLLFWSIVALVFGGKSGFAALLGSLLGHIHWLIPYTLLHIIFVCWGTWLIMLVLTLKSFVYNLYQGLLLGLADAVDDYQREQKRTVLKANSSSW